MGSDSWDMALLESEVRGLVKNQRKQKQNTRQRSKTADGLAAKHLKRRAPTEQGDEKPGKAAGKRDEKPGKAAGPRVEPAAGSNLDTVNRKAFAQHLDLERWPCGPKGKRLKVGSDCSGLDAAMVAMDKLGVSDRVTLEFCCDKLPECQTFLKAVHKPKLLFTDVVNRDLEKVPKVDVYTAGFPCQPWSSEGKRQGRRDQLGRGKVFDHVAKYIEKHQPKVFLLENVQAMTFKTHKKAFEAMLCTLRQSGSYFVTWRVLNASHFGLPQSRPRLYIVGLLRTALRSDVVGFPWPKPKVMDPLPLRRFLCGGRGVLRSTWRPDSCLALQIKEGEASIRAAGENPHEKMFTLDAHSGRGTPTTMHDRIPCLTRTRAGCGGYFLTHKDFCRFLSVEEMLNLQGLPATFRDVARDQRITDRQLAMMVGNAIPTNVLMLLLARMLTMVGLQGETQ